ncbi:MAG: hypothetical protein ABIH34_01890 [Nanoarchaeota archaeon]
MKYIALLMTSLMLLAACIPQEKANLDRQDLSNIFDDSQIGDKEAPEDYKELELEFEEETVDEDNGIITINFPSEEIGGGTIDRKLEFTPGGDDYTQTFVLEFNGVDDYELIEELPKSFAESAKDIEFSIEPEIIDDDPLVKWFIDNQVQKIEMNVKNQVVGAAALAGIKAWMDGGDKQQAAINAGGDAAVSALFDNIDDFAILNHLSKCKKYAKNKDGEINAAIQEQECIYQLIQKYPQEFTVTDCKHLTGPFYLQQTWEATCKAIIKNDLSHCMEFESMDEYAEKYEGICRDYYFTAMDNLCQDEECMLNICIATTHESCCEFIKDPTRNKKCMALTTLNPVYCKDIKDMAEATACCNQMVVDKQDCLDSLQPTEELEDLPEEQEEQQEFRDKSSHCPYPVGPNAVWIESGYNTAFTEGWKEHGKWVGVVKNYRNKEEGIYSSVICYKDGVKHGPEQTFNGEGKKITEYNWEDGVAHGDWTVYFPSGQVQSISTYDHNIRTGEFKAYFEDGSVNTEGQYKDGDLFGKWNFYNQDGSLSMEQEYDVGGKQTLYKTY